MSTKFKLFTQYCEDVRQEADGRQSMMGIFPVTAAVGLEMGAKIPRIFVQAVVSMPAKEEVRSLRIVISWNGEPINEVSLPDEELQKVKDRQSDASSPATGEIVVTAYAAMFDIDAQEGGELRTDAEINDTVVKGRPLRFRVESP